MQARRRELGVQGARASSGGSEGTTEMGSSTCVRIGAGLGGILCDITNKTPRRMDYCRSPSADALCSRRKKLNQIQIVQFNLEMVSQRKKNSHAPCT